MYTTRPRLITSLYTIRNSYPPYVSMEEYTGCCVFSLSGYRYLATVAPIGVKFCMMVHIGPGQIFTFWGCISRGTPTSETLGLNFGHLTANISKTVSRGVTMSIELNISSTRTFHASHGAVAPPHMAVLCLADALFWSR